VDRECGGLVARCDRSGLVELADLHAGFHDGQRMASVIRLSSPRSFDLSDLDDYRCCHYARGVRRYQAMVWSLGRNRKAGFGGPA
jgi:hypothetical protein